MSNLSDLRHVDLPEPDGPVLLATLAGAVRGQDLTAEIERGRLRVADAQGGPAVELECRRRASDGDRWWYTLGGAWLCEASKPFEAMATVKGALLRQVRT